MISNSTAYTLLATILVILVIAIVLVALHAWEHAHREDDDDQDQDYWPEGPRYYPTFETDPEKIARYLGGEGWG